MFVMANRYTDRHVFKVKRDLSWDDDLCHGSLRSGVAVLGNGMQSAQISDEDRVRFASTIAAYGTPRPTFEQRRPNYVFQYEMQSSHPEGPIFVYRDDADGSLLLSGKRVEVESR